MKKKSFRFAPSVSQPTFVRRRKREMTFGLRNSSRGRSIMKRVAVGGLLLLAMSTGCGKGWLPCLTRGDACFAPGCGLGGGMPGPQDPCNDPARFYHGTGSDPQNHGFPGNDRPSSTLALRKSLRLRLGGIAPDKRLSHIEPLRDCVGAFGSSPWHQVAAWGPSASRGNAEPAIRP